MTEIRSDQSQYYAAKALFERILGRSAFLRVKDYGPLSAWRHNYSKLLRAVAVSVKATVEVVDTEWTSQLSALLDLGEKRLSEAKSIDELHAAAAATLGELVFLQLGFVPQGHYQVRNVPLVAGNWKLDRVRTVQYVQSAEQKARQVVLSRPRARRNET